MKIYFFIAPKSSIPQNQICRFFRNHNDRSIRIPRNNRGHNRSIHYPQTFNTPHAELFIHHRHFVGAHFAGANGVVTVSTRRLMCSMMASSEAPFAGGVTLDLVIARNGL